MAELVAGRLAREVGAGARAEIVRVVDEATGGRAELQHLLGVNLGTLDVPNTVNAREVQKFIGHPHQFGSDRIDSAARARVVTFQTWLGMGTARC